jgi:UDP-2-acetamido-2-deoxy-ribo-hexuluronate aminotransferase
MQFVDLKRQYHEYKTEIMAEVERVLDNTAFINGPAIKELEANLAEHTGVAHAIGCSSGTDSLILGMMALDIKRDDEVIVPDFSFIATGETVSLMAAKPVFVDVREDTYNIDSDAIRAAITEKTVGIIPVSLYGQAADLDEINAIAAEHGLWVLEDAAQSYGATYKDRKSCAVTQIASTSFFPAKPLGAYGDGGAVFTDSDEHAARLRMILNHGQRARYDHAVIGLNARLDTIQAAVLKVKLAHFDEEIERRQEVADWYTDALDGAVVTPTILGHNRSVWAQYTIRVSNRGAVQAALKDAGIPSAVHYPIPLHKQDAFADDIDRPVHAPITERASSQVMSLPMHPFLTRDEVANVADVVKRTAEPIST